MQTQPSPSRLQLPLPHVQGWSIVGWVGALLAAVVAGLYALHGFNEEMVRAVVRATAQLAVVFFLAAFVASSLRRVWRSPASAWLLANRRYLGVSFALAHFAHLDALIALGIWFPDPFVAELDALTLIGGGLGYAFIAAMTATSFDRSAAWLGRRNWVRLHKTGSYWLWLIFLNSYLFRAVVDPFYAPFALALLAVVGLRIWVWVQSRSVAAHPSTG